MKATLVFFGKASKFAESECQKYLKRMNNVQVLELKESKKSTPLEKLLEEWKSLEKVLKKRPLVVLTEEGDLFSSVVFSKKLADQFPRDFCFVVGSAYGLHADCKKYASLKLSLSPMTLTHDHARVLLVEQLYRAVCIQAGHPYHHV